MNYEELVNRLTSKSFFSPSAGLYRMKKMMDHFGNPEERLSFIHVAGTNGKGSVCAMLHGILNEAGYRVGLFTSPYIHDFRERIQISGEWIEKEALVEIGEAVLAYTEKLYEPPNQFEILTMIAMLYFVKKQCDVVILETGLGGTYDSTNVIPRSLVSIITNIGLDHCAVLGNTIPQIAAAKAGIIKPRGNVVLYPSGKEALDVITAVAMKQDARLFYVDKSDVHRYTASPDWEELEYKGMRVRLNLPGEHQCYNCALVLEAVRILNQGAFFITDSDIETALARVSWPGRLELVRRSPRVYVDGGHNPQGIRAVLAFLRERFPKQKHYFLVGILKDKDYRTMLTELKEDAEKLFFLRVSHPRGFSEEECEELCEEYGMEPVTEIRPLIPRLLAEVSSDSVICCTGSLYLADRFLQEWKEDNVKQGGET